MKKVTSTEMRKKCRKEGKERREVRDSVEEESEERRNSKSEIN